MSFSSFNLNSMGRLVKILHNQWTKRTRKRCVQEPTVLPSALTSTVSIFVLNVCYIIFMSVSSICPTALDFNLLVFALTSWIICFSLCVLKFHIKRGTVTEIFGNCSANGKFRSFVGVQKLMPNHFCQRKARVGDKIAFVGGVADVTSQQMTSFRTLLAIELERRN